MAMTPIRVSNIMGLNRKIFLCACGEEIFFVKEGEIFKKFTVKGIETSDDEHICTAVFKFDKECFTCHELIKIYKQGNKWVKENQDGSPHVDEKSNNGNNRGGKYFCADCERWVPKHRLHSCDTDDPADDIF